MIASLAAQLRLSDAIVLSGAAVYLSDFYDQLKVFCWRKNHRSIASFYIDHPKIEVVAIDSEDEVMDASADVMLKTGWHSEDRPLPDESWNAWFYRQLSLPYEVRWTHCPIGKACQKIRQRAWPLRTPLVHDDITRRYEINQLPDHFLRVTENGESILSLASAIESAPSVHVIKSAIFDLVESLQPRGELYLHRYARAFKPIRDEAKMRHDWKIIY